MPLFFYNICGTIFMLLAGGAVLLVGRWRRGLRERLSLVPTPPWVYEDRERFWIHGASVGEVLAAAGLIEELLHERPNSRVVISTFTPTGREVARRRYGHLGDRVHFTLLPLDWNGLPARILRRFRPDLFVMLETELWPNLLHALRRAGRPVILVNGRLSSKSFPRYRVFRWFFRPLLESFTAACVRTAGDAERFRLLGVPAGRIRVVGNLKYDRAGEGGIDARLVALHQRVMATTTRKRLFVAGSLHNGEVEMVLAAFSELGTRFKDLVLILVPRHPERFGVGILEGGKMPWVRWSAVSPGGLPGDTRILLVDTLGELADFYGIAALAFVGGSLVRRGGHNLLEPAFRSVPVLFGPDYTNFEEEGRALLLAGGGFMIEGAKEMVEVAARLLSDNEFRESSGRKAGEVAGGFGGAVEKTMSVVREILGGRPA